MTGVLVGLALVALGGVFLVAGITGRPKAVIGIEDDGVGIPESVDIDNSPGFGLMLVGTLAKQLKGNIRIERGGGTSASYRSWVPRYGRQTKALHIAGLSFRLRRKSYTGRGK
ncbi:MAG: hypothetical protein NTU41_01665 [Chloroflexi bacterium]|nr:hypothetical protein [Chloroflexota bacterium]